MRGAAERLLGLAATVASIVAFAGPMPIGDPGGIESHSVGKTNLFLRGRAVHRRLVFNIYELSLYLKDITLAADQIISSQETKYARLKFLRKLTAKEIRDEFVLTFNENCLGECETLRPQLSLFLDAIPNMPSGSVIEFLFQTDMTVVSMPSHAAAMNFPGTEFGRLFLRSWVGPHPPSERFKRELLEP